MQSYTEPHRKYHTLQHLSECIGYFESSRGLAVHPEEVEMALWFHDAIYDVPGNQNEARSADWAVEALTAVNAAPEVRERVKQLILATRHDVLPSTDDERLIVDIDLSILGAEPARFEEYERQVGEEYAHVPQQLFLRKRKEIMRQFLARPRIYSTAQFHDALEARARKNLERSISRRKP
jgi:predicted metal-dependent HD superfamily phosphohydrolase